MHAYIAKGLQMARDCHHPDAQWLASLFPSGVVLTQELLDEAMRKQGEDQRAKFFLFKARGFRDIASLQCAAHEGYAPAQAHLVGYTEDAEAFG
jgi:hypothetical protein